MDESSVRECLLSLGNVKQVYPFREDLAVFRLSLGDKEDMFAMYKEGKSPVNLSLRCDPQLSKILRDKYETVMPGEHLSKRKWNTIVLAGQLPWEEVKGLIVNAYELVKSELESN